jgi:branched-chain amino acid transport system ATP-binding protein
VKCAAAKSGLRLRDVSVRFGGVQALDAIAFDAPPSIIFGIIGPNGAGKTTLFNCISGLLRPMHGASIMFDGIELVRRPVHKVAGLGIGRTFQNISLLREHTVRENILTGLHLALPYGPLSSFFPGRRVRNAEAAAAVKLNDVMDLLNLPRRMLDVRVDSLSLGQQKKVEVARAIVRGPRLLLLDEPAGGLNDRETSDFSASLRGLQRELLLSVVLIDHDMNLVMDICDRLCVLSFGKLIAEGTPAEVQENSDVISVYLGDALAA